MHLFQPIRRDAPDKKPAPNLLPTTKRPVRFGWFPNSGFSRHGKRERVRQRFPNWSWGTRASIIILSLSPINLTGLTGFTGLHIYINMIYRVNPVHPVHPVQKKDHDIELIGGERAQHHRARRFARNDRIEKTKYTG